MVMILLQSAQSCLPLCDHMDCSLPGSSVHGISQAKILEWVTISSSRDSKASFSLQESPCLASCELRFPAWAKGSSWRSFLRSCFPGVKVLV